MKSSTAVQPAGLRAINVSSIEEVTGRRKRIRDLVARRAYELYEKRGRTDGHAEEDWSQAQGETMFQLSSRMRISDM